MSDPVFFVELGQKCIRTRTVIVLEKKASLLRLSMLIHLAKAREK